MDSVTVPTAHADLLSLGLPDKAEHFDVRCRNCDSQIRFELDDIDQLQSLYFCMGRNCDQEWSWYDLHRGKHVTAIETFFYTVVRVQSDIWVLEEDEANGRRFHRLREASDSECWTSAWTRHLRLRNKLQADHRKR